MVDPGKSPHNRILASSRGGADRQLWITTLMWNHRNHIRELIVTGDTVLLACLDANLTGLQAVTFGSGSWDKELFYSSLAHLSISAADFTDFSDPIRGRSEPFLPDVEEEEEEVDGQEIDLKSSNQGYAIVEQLMLSSIDSGPSGTIDAIFAQMTSLVHLTLVDCTVDDSTLAAFARSFKNLQHIQIDLQDECSSELIGLFVGCPKLRNCLGRGLVIIANDVVNSPDWNCLGLEKLGIKIAGVPRLTKDQERLLMIMGD
ncbi:hypothetical protein BGX29_003035 [Mortierella sp. GBA35]|nr:hypothetical protein BGX29_003035 [Mortierella sp. GBA35]